LGGAHADFTKTVQQKGDCSAGTVAYGDRPHIHYKGFLEDGTEFDSSYARHTPISFPAGHEFVIKCWDDAVIGMCVGEEIRLICPPEIAYGDRGAGDVIPPGATLTFDMKLVKIGETSADN